jgi:hypothetical protein
MTIISFSYCYAECQYADRENALCRIFLLLCWLSLHWVSYFFNAYSLYIECHIFLLLCWLSLYWVSYFLIDMLTFVILCVVFLIAMLLTSIMSVIFSYCYANCWYAECLIFLLLYWVSFFLLPCCWPVWWVSYFLITMLIIGILNVLFSNCYALSLIFSLLCWVSYFLFVMLVSYFLIATLGVIFPDCNAVWYFLIIMPSVIICYVVFSENKPSGI